MDFSCSHPSNDTERNARNLTSAEMRNANSAGMSGKADLVRAVNEAGLKRRRKRKRSRPLIKRSVGTAKTTRGAHNQPQ